MLKKKKTLMKHLVFLKIKTRNIRAQLRGMM